MTSDGGTYGLVYAVSDRIAPAVGALGTRAFPQGGYVYVGSALGAGGFARIDRHERVARGDHDTRHWHVDYLGGHDAVSLAADRRVSGRDVECALADQLRGDESRSVNAVDACAGFGASDCDCPTHLVGFPDADAALAALDRAVETLDASGSGPVE